MHLEERRPCSLVNFELSVIISCPLPADGGSAPEMGRNRPAHRVKSRREKEKSNRHDFFISLCLRPMPAWTSQFNQPMASPRFL